MDAWIETLPWWLIVFSAVSFVASLLVVPFIVVRIPHDYFLAPRRRVSGWGLRGTVLRTIIVVLKNILGLLLVLAGVAMLVLPGQGVLTILIGLGVMNFPGKYRLECFLISRGPVLRSINWIRRRRGVEPLRPASQRVRAEG